MCKQCPFKWMHCICMHDGHIMRSCCIQEWLLKLLFSCAEEEGPPIGSHAAGVEFPHANQRCPGMFLSVTCLSPNLNMLMTCAGK